MAWGQSPDPSVVGYFLYYGESTTNYTTQVDVGTNTAYTVSGLADSTTYYFVVAAYDAYGDQSAPSDPVMVVTPDSGGLELAPVSNVSLNGPQRVMVTNSVDNSLNLAGPLTYSLDQGAPEGMSIDPVKGTIVWNPSVFQAGSTNFVTVRISDGSVPPFTDTQTFAIVLGDASQLNIGSGVIAVGGGGYVTATLNCSGLVSNIIFELNGPAERLGSLSVQSLLPNLSVTQTQLGPADTLVQLQITDGQYLHGTNNVAEIYITANSPQSSAFTTLCCPNMTCTQPGGQIATTVPGQDSKLVLVGQDSLMEAQLTNGIRQLVLYGPIGANYNVESTPDLAPPCTWTPEFSMQMTNLCQVFQNISRDTTSKFYRAHRM